MPYTIEWHDRGIVWTYTGTLTGPELLQSNFEIFGDGRFDEIEYQIADLTGVEKFELTETHMQKIAHLDMAAARSNPRIRVAVVTGSKTGVELTRIYQKNVTEKSTWKIGIFENPEDARIWLGIQGECS